MTPLALELPIAWGPDSERGTGTAPPDPGGEPTLDSVLSGMWEGLVAHRSVPCPMCGGEVRPRYGVHARPTGGSCTSCGTELS